jgi:signal transduction histidine kinase/ActR/RegA family two-component response regulator
LGIAILVAYILPPVIGLSFLVFVIEMITGAQLVKVMSSSVLPFYVLGTTVGAFFYFRWFLRPLSRFADEEIELDEALKRMRRFSSHYWVLYVLRHLTGSIVLSLSARSVLGMEFSLDGWVQMAALGVMLSCLAGLPVYAYIMDLFAKTFKAHPLREPVFRIRTRVILVAALIPVVLNTAVLQYLLARLGGLTLELLALWVSLLVFAVAASYNLMSSLSRSVAELRVVSERRGDLSDLKPETLRVRSLDELGVLTCEYRELLQDMQRQAKLLDLRNQLLVASSSDSEPDAVYRGLLEIVTGFFHSERGRLVAINDVAQSMEVLAVKGEEMSGPQSAPEELVEALKKFTPSFVEATAIEDMRFPSGVVAIVPLSEAVSTNEHLAVIAQLESADDVERCELELFEQMRDEIAATVRGTRLEKERARLERVLLESQRMDMVGRLAAGVAHDFNNILTVIVNSASLLKFEAKNERVQGEVVDEYSKIIMESTKRASALTRQLLTFSRQHIGQVTVLDLNRLVEDIDGFLRRLIPEDINYEVTLSPELRAIRADKGHIEQVITNLMVNARDAMENGGTLKLETAQEDDHVLLRVIDDGCGMKPEVLAHLFEPFFTTKAPDKGTGLGLATTYGIVNSYKGQIQVDSKPGEGTTMTVRLPAAEEAASSEVKKKFAPTSDASGHVILLVEDEDSVRRVLGDVLSGQGFVVLPVSCGEDAIALIEDTSTKIDLVLSDIIMPGIKGTEVAQRVNQVRPQTKVLLMTGYADAKSIETARAENFTILNKPFAPEALLDKLGSLLSTPSADASRGDSPVLH